MLCLLIRLILTMPLMLVGTLGLGELVGGTLQAWAEREDPIVWMLGTQCTKYLMLRRMLSLRRYLCYCAMCLCMYVCT